jgi:hypothetical protein
MPKGIFEATADFMAEVVYVNEVEPQLRLLGIGTDRKQEGPTMTYFNGVEKVRCKCGWEGYPVHLDGNSENKCPECGRTVPMKARN